jgi:predicted methyltransferase
MNAITDLAHRYLRAVLRPGDAAVDATVGNGRDTAFLAECVGPAGRVHGFDIQPEALARTRARLDAANISLVLECHGRMREWVREPVRAVAFNLGYLPMGDRQITTRTETTIRALEAAIGLLQPGGAITVIAYRGHPGGLDETDAVRIRLKELPADAFDVSEIPASDAPASPVLFVATKLTT